MDTIADIRGDVLSRDWERKFHIGGPLYYAFHEWGVPMHFGPTARNLILETAENILDAIEGETDVTDARLTVDNNGAWEWASPVGVQEGIDLAGELYNHSWEPEIGDMRTLSEIVDNFTHELASSIAEAVLDALEAVAADHEGDDECDGCERELDAGDDRLCDECAAHGCEEED